MSQKKKPGPPRRQFSASTREAIIHDYLHTDMKVSEIREKYKMSHLRHLVRILDEEGVKRRPAGWQPGTRHHGWKGGYKKRGAYIAVRMDPDDPLYSMAPKSGYVLEHRLVMARKLGRPLAPTETVHHINGDITCNVPENLELRQGSHGKGVRYACMDCGSHNVTTIALSSEESGLGS